MSTDGRVEVEFTSKMASLLRDFDLLGKSATSSIEKLSKIALESKAAGKSITDEARAAERVTREQMTATERLQAKQAELNEMFNKSQISYTTWKRASTQVDKQLLEANEEYQRTLKAEAETVRENEQRKRAADEATLRRTKMRQAAEENLRAAAERVYRETESGEERVKRKMLELDVLRRRGLIDTETHRKAVVQLGDSGEKSFGQMIGGAGKTALAMLGIGTAAAAVLKSISLINAELDAASARASRAADHQLSQTQVKRALVRNLDPGDRAKVQAAADKIAAETGAEQGAVTAAAGAVSSARGSMSQDEAMNQLRATVKLDPSLGSAELAELSGAGINIRRAFGGTAEQSIGMLLAGVRSSRVENTGQYAANIVPGVLGLSNAAYGMTAQEAFGLTSAFSQITGDKTGAQSRTGSLQFASQIVKQTNAIPELRGRSFSERLAFLMNDPRGQKMRAAMVGRLGGELAVQRRGMKAGEELSGEAVTLPAMIGILTPGSKEQAEFQAAMGKIPTMEGAGGVYAAAVSESHEATPVANIDEKLRALSEIQRSDVNRGVRGVLEKRLGEALDDSGAMGTVERDLVMKKFQIDMTGGATPMKALRSAEVAAIDGYIRASQGPEGSPLAAAGFALNLLNWGEGFSDRFNGRDPESRAQAAAMERLIEAINGLKKEFAAAVPSKRPNGPLPQVMQPSAVP